MVFELFRKVKSVTLCKQIHEVMNYIPFSFVLLNLGSVERKQQQQQQQQQQFKKNEYLKNEESFLDKIKSIFYSFWRAIIWWKIEK